MATEGGDIQIVLEMIDRKPEISLRVGQDQILRNSEELEDLHKVIEHLAPKAFMYGLSGGRKETGSYSYTLDATAKQLGVSPTDSRVIDFYSDLQETLTSIDPKQRVDLSRFGLDQIGQNLSYHNFIRDIDLVAVVDIQGRYPNSIHSIEGPLSRTDFDLFLVTPEMIMNDLRNNTSLENFKKASRITNL